MPGGRPNVLVLVQDQLRYDLVAGAEPVRTPTFDRVRGEGTWFTRAYTPCGICGPARGSLFTGLYPHSHGVLNNVSGTDAVSRSLPTHLPTLAGLLRDAGYRTGYAGKWHLGGDTGAAGYGFDDVLVDDPYTWRTYTKWAESFAEGNPDAVHTRYPPMLPRLAERFRRTGFPLYTDTPLEEEDIPARGIADATIELLERYGSLGSRAPFFLVGSFLEPHWPFALPAKYAGMYDPAAIPPWPNFDDDFDGKPRTNQAGLRHFGVSHFTWDDWRPVVARYFGSVSFLDDLVGRVIAALDGLGLADDTLVLLSADHGDMAGAHRQFNKGPLMYEEVYRIPFLWRGPGVAAGVETDTFASHLDVLPTVLDAADVTVPDGMHGRSLRPVLGGGAGGDEWRDAVMCEFHGDEFGLYSQRMVRVGRHKLVYNPNDLTELYDLEADPWELQNLATDPAHATLRRELEGRLLELMDDSGDSLRLWARNVLG